ncbi:MAG: DMT family transporter [Candidatus Micrarchaeia archaeon]|jgi:drug/metabolite transporter (DMT)-like permease
MVLSKGIYLALLTALISGFSVFINGFAVTGFDPFVFTTLKNVFVVAGICSLILLAREAKEIKTLTRAQWTKLIAIGAVGGSVPFLLFFWGLSLSSGAVGSLIYRLLFVFAAGIAFVFLKEKLNAKMLAGGALLVAGNILLLKGAIGFGFGELLVLLATILWAVEFNISKTALAGIKPNIVVFGRMFFGSTIMLAFLFATGRVDTIATLAPVNWEWVAITSIFLLGYVFVWYRALALAPVSIATPVLALGGPITALLSLFFIGKAIAPVEAIGMLLIIIGVAVIANAYGIFRSLLQPKTVRL